MLTFLLQLALAFFIASFIMSMMNGKKQKQAELERHQRKLEEYEILTKDNLLSYDNSKTIEAVCFHLQEKSNGSYEEALEAFNPSERLVYALYQLELAVSTPRVSINDFFVRASELVGEMPSIFETLKLEEAKSIYAEAYQLYVKIQEEYNKDVEEVIDELEEDVENYGTEKNFDDYSKELKAIFNNIVYISALANFIKENVEDFIDEED